LSDRKSQGNRQRDLAGTRGSGGDTNPAQAHFTPQQLSQPDGQQAWAIAQHAAARAQHPAALQQSPQSLPQQVGQFSAHPAQLPHVAAGLAAQQLEQSAAHAGQAAQPSAHATHGTAQQPAGPFAWVEPAASQPVRPARDRVTANSDLVANMIRSPLLEWNASTFAVMDGEPAGSTDASGDAAG
jgi:hypothetical protein